MTSEQKKVVFPRSEVKLASDGTAALHSMLMYHLLELASVIRGAVQKVLQNTDDEDKI